MQAISRCFQLPPHPALPVNTMTPLQPHASPAQPVAAHALTTSFVLDVPTELPGIPKVFALPLKILAPFSKK